MPPAPDYTQYLILAAVVAVAYYIRNHGLSLPSFGRPTLPPTAFTPPPLAVSTNLFAMAHALAKAEAAAELDAKFAEEARAAAVAVYKAPFSGPPASQPPAP